MRSLACVAVVLGVAGCGLTDKPVTVKGRVTFQGEPVTEGIIQYLHVKTQKASDAYLGPDGRYEIDVLPGWYTIVLFPPSVPDSSPGIVGQKLKEVRNIPTKYQMAPTSGLRVEVTADAAAHDFDLKP